MKNLLLFCILAAIILMIAACPMVNNQAELKCGFLEGRNCFCAEYINKNPASPCTDSASLCPYLPHDVDARITAGYNGFSPECQYPFDWFSWQTFIALNWPANPNGSPLVGTGINSYPNAPRIWETYEDPDEIFNNMTKPKDGLTILGSVSKSGFSHFPINHDSYFEAFTKPVIDRNLNFALYEVRVNPKEVTYITNNKLNTYTGQQAFAGPVNFPIGSYRDDNVGAMEIKVAWRILVPKVDSFDHYYHRQAIIQVDKDRVIGGNKAITDTVTVGLIGMHIIRKVSNLGKFWIWSTFEHVDNAPDCASSSKKAGSFYNPACTNCKPNNKPPALLPGDSTFLWSPSSSSEKNKSPQYARRYAIDGKYGTQVCRLYPVEPSADAVTKIWQERLKGTVWQYYRLIGSQWGIVFGDAPPFDSLIGIPLNQANTVAETYLQDTTAMFVKKHPGSGSCFNCHHKFATTSTSSSGKPIKSDFSFLLGIPTPPTKK